MGSFSRFRTNNVKSQLWSHMPSPPLWNETLYKKGTRHRTESSSAVTGQISMKKSSFKSLCRNRVPQFFHCALVQFHSLEVLLLLTTQWPVSAPVKLLGGALWRPCYFTSLHSLTGPVGQPFASHLGVQRFESRGCTNSQWNQVTPVSMSRYKYVLETYTLLVPTFWSIY